MNDKLRDLIKEALQEELVSLHLPEVYFNALAEKVVGVVSCYFITGALEHFDKTLQVEDEPVDSDDVRTEAEKDPALRGLTQDDGTFDSRIELGGGKDA